MEIGLIVTLIAAMITAIGSIIAAVIQRKQSKKDASPAPQPETPVVQPDNAANVGNSMVLRNEGDEYRKLGNNDKALEKYRSAAELEPDEALNHDKLAEVLNQLRRYDEALEENIKAVAREKDSTKKAQYYRNKADTLLSLKRALDAETDMREAIRLAPDNAAYHHDLGLHLGLEGYTDLKRATELAPDNAAYYFDFGEYLHKLMRSAEAVNAYQRAAELHFSFSATGLAHLGECLMWQHRYEEAVDTIMQATKKATDSTPIENWSLYCLGYSLFELGRYEEALDVSRKVTQLEPKNDLYDLCSGLLKLCLLRLGRTEEYLAALEYFESRGFGGKILH